MNKVDNSPDDVVIASQYGDTLARTKGASPHKRLPERSSWQERETRQRPDGSIYGLVRNVDRWAGSFNYGPWTPEKRPGDGSDAKVSK